MSRKSNTEQRRAEIVSALLAVMADQGYEKATIQSIAKQAGLTPGLIHYHFQSKGEILIALVHSLAQFSRARYAYFASEATTPRERLNACIDARLAKGEGANPDAVSAWVVIGAEAVRQPEVRQAYQEAISSELAVLEEVITECLTEDGKRTDNASPLAAALLAFMEGAFQLASAARDIMPQGYAARMAIEMVERYIDAEPEKKRRSSRK
ncbi:MAG: TetR/AcrR family transcriptional regulator [Burkholderiales bacterium]|nr:TetR/AcrR family transcriptional regulator [Burkholderiales bacterium]